MVNDFICIYGWRLMVRNKAALLFLKREGARRNALRVQRPTSSHLEDKRKHRMARPLRSRSRMAIG